MCDRVKTVREFDGEPSRATVVVSFWIETSAHHVRNRNRTACFEKAHHILPAYKHPFQASLDTSPSISSGNSFPAGSCKSRMTRTNRTGRQKLPCHRVDGQTLSQLSQLRLQSRMMWLILRGSSRCRREKNPPRDQQ